MRSLDAEHIEAANYIKKITSSLEFFERAAALKEKGDLFGAITLLKKCDRRMDSAQTELQNIREVLKSRIDALEKTMVDLYNKKKYPESINLGKKYFLPIRITERHPSIYAVPAGDMKRTENFSRRGNAHSV